MRIVDFQNVRVNPLGVASATLFIVAPFLSWITVSAFGLTAESNLFDIAGSRAPLSLPLALPELSLWAAILLVLGGMMLLRMAKIGLPVATAGLALFLIDSYSLFGSKASIIPIVVAPGIGLLAALTSVGVGALSFRVKRQDLNGLIHRIRTAEGLTELGLFIATLGLVLDGLNHAGLGQLPAFLGTGMVEPVFHMGFLASIFLLAFLFPLRKEFHSVTMNTALIASAFAFIILDASFHISTGEVSGFLGHDLTEIVLHVSTYYGAAFLVIARLLKN